MSDTPLAQKLRALIALNGPMRIADYMAHCLGDPEHGYYTNRDPLGRAGDFITAPEISQMFGEIVGAWLIEAWRESGAPSPARLVELGPGRGTMMADILRVAARVPDFFEAVSLHLVETSPVLRKRQAKALASPALTPAWHDSFREVPRGAIFLVANEFLDALPIRQFVRVKGVWRELMVGLGENDELAFVIGPTTIGDAAEAADGSFLELGQVASSYAQAIAGRIVTDGGAALLIDYGYVQLDPRANTLQAVRGHAYANPLETPGEADLTAHVDFSALAEAARSAGATAHGPMPQGEFLMKLGLRERAIRLAAHASEPRRLALHAAVDRLTGADQMGELFKVLAITRNGVRIVPF